MKHNSLVTPLTTVRLLALGMAVLTSNASANYIGGEAPILCQQCGAPNYYSAQTQGIGFTEGNIKETVPISRVRGSLGPSLSLDLNYNSYNADGSHAMIDTGLGFGWTHSYNLMLFSQVGSLFRLDADGRTEKLQAGPGGTYTSDAGYYETLVRNSDGSYTLTTKDRNSYRFATVPGTSLILPGSIYRLQSITNRNGTTVTLTYAGGNLTRVTDTYGRSLQFGYNAQNHLSQVTDPLGRATTFTYDSTGRRLTRVTDPAGKTTVYSYNALNQFTTKTDRDGRTYTYQYQNNLPIGIKDSSASNLFSLSNPSKWATSPTALAASQQRVYVPSTASQTDGRGNVWRYQYDPHGFPTNTIAPDGSTTSYTYDPTALRVSTVTDSLGRTTHYQYDAMGNRTNTTDALGNVTTYTYEPVFNQVTSVTDPNGRVTVYQYDASGNRTNETDPLGETRSWSYDTHGNILSQTDRLGHTTTYQYDAFGECTNMTDPLGHSTTWAYDAEGNQTSRTDPLGHTTTYAYDALDRLTSITDPLGHTTRFAYDAAGDRIETIDPNGNATTYGYDLRQRLIDTTNALGGTTVTAYDANDNVISRTDPRGYTTTYAYDVRNRQVQVIDPLSGMTTTTYDPVGNVLSTTDPNGHPTTYSYDALNRVITQTDALGHTTTYDYVSTAGPACCGATAGSSLIAEQIDGNGKITYYEYDELNRLTQEVRKSGGTANVITPSDAVTTYAYDAENKVLSVTEPNTNTTYYMYDALHRRIGQTNAAGDVTVTTYDDAGRVIATTQPNGNVITNIYDAADRLVQVQDQGGLVSTTAYDAAGNVTQTADGLGDATTYAYDGLNRRITATDALGHSATTTYDPVGNVLSATDRNGHTTTYTYDALNRRATTLDALGGVSTTAYDAVGNVLSVTDANGHITTYTYDPCNRRTTETFPGASPNTRTNGYDAVGNVISRVDQKGQVTTYFYNDFYYLTNRHYQPSGVEDQYSYDLAGRMLSANRAGWLDTFSYDGANRLLQSAQNGASISYAYDIPGRHSAITYPGGRMIVATNDARNRLTSMTDGAPPIASFIYDAADRVTGREFRNGTMTTYSYDSNNRLTNVSHTLGAATLTAYGYDYDNEANKRFEAKLHLPGDSEAYAYDVKDRLIDFRVGSLAGSTIPAPLEHKVWSLDFLGNWNLVQSNGVPEVRTHGPANEILSINAASLSYDANGNLRQDALYNYAYDEENRLTQVVRLSDLSLVGQYAYDALGRRIEKIANPAGTASTNLYFYDGPKLIEERDGLGATVATYTYGGGYTDEVLTMDRGGQSYYYHQNALWTPEAITDSTGTVVERYAFDAYGLPAVMDGTGAAIPANAWGTPHSAIGNSWLFTGRQFDEEAGLYFYRARYYDPVKGRFLQRDPLGYLDGFNLYEYVSSNPIDRVDPTGTTKGLVPHVIPGYSLGLNISTLTVDFRVDDDECSVEYVKRTLTGFNGVGISAGGAGITVGIGATVDAEVDVDSTWYRQCSTTYDCCCRNSQGERADWLKQQKCMKVRVQIYKTLGVIIAVRWKSQEFFLTQCTSCSCTCTEKKFNLTCTAR